METLAGNRHFAVIYVLMIICVGAKVSAKASPLVQAPSGRYLGVNVPGNSGSPYEAFMGIPFAQPPIGNLRFAVSLFNFLTARDLNSLIINPIAFFSYNQTKIMFNQITCIYKKCIS